MRVEPARLAFLVFHRVGGDDTLPGADRAGAAEPGLGAAEHLLLDHQPLLAVLVLEQARRPVAEARVDVAVPQIERFEHMTVGVDNVVGAAHSGLLCWWLCCTRLLRRCAPRN